MRFLITGASGLVGSALVRRIVAEHGAQSVQLMVGATPRHAPESRRLQRLRDAGLTVLPCNLLGGALHRQQVKPFDVLFHLAAFTETETDSPLVRVNDHGTQRLLHHLTPLLPGKRVVYTGSLASVDRQRPDDTPLGEDHPCTPRTVYGRTKLAGERILREHAKRTGFEWCVLRLPTVYGPGYRPGGLFDVLPAGLVRGALATRLNWPGRMSLVFVDDVAEALAGLATHPAGRNALYHLASDQRPRLDELIAAIAHHLGLPRHRIELPDELWSVVRRLAWTPGLAATLPFAARIALWRISLVVTDGLVADASRLHTHLDLHHTPLEEGLAATYGDSFVASREALDATCSVVVPCRNERGNIEPAVQRIPDMGRHTEILFVEGHSADGTLAECERVRAAHPQRDITVLTQDGTGKFDAVRKGFAHAKNDVLIILDADLTVDPEELPRFFHEVTTRPAALVIGSRFVHPMAHGAMRPLNYLGNRFFGTVLSLLLKQPLADTLCGTKALWRRDYERLAAADEHRANADPFGDFDLLFGAKRLGLQIVELPVRYRARTYGEPQIRRFRDGATLLAMVLRSLWHRP